MNDYDWLHTIPYRLGTSSYIIPADILPNVHWLADRVRDVELVLFEVDDGSNNLPTPEVIAELGAVGRRTGLSYTVHLPLDLRLGDDGAEGHVSLEKARRVIERTRELEPWAYVVHLDGRAVREQAGTAAYRRWVDHSVRALELAAGWAGDPALLAVENLEGYPLDFWEPVLARIPVSRTVDIGHLWRDGHDALPFLRAALPRTRVIHLHGVGERDHQSLRHTPPEDLAGVMQLLAAEYRGVVTLEIFNEEDLVTSLQAMRICGNGAA